MGSKRWWVVYGFARKAVSRRRNLAKVGAMKPKPSPCEDLQGDLFRIELQAIVDVNHAMVNPDYSREFEIIAENKNVNP